ncbi:hypothetical protein FOA52_005599 [Chlamydomonas sp. UWO 241]|nr:hypothetical protein FOA52_005599 [Chlamydomonas sp. UWO 241]
MDTTLSPCSMAHHHAQIDGPRVGGRLATRRKQTGHNRRASKSHARVQGLDLICVDLVVVSMEDLPTGVLLDILVRTGAWKGAGKECLSVCRTWREALMGSPADMASLLVGAHGGSKEAALVAACTMGHEGATRHLLELAADPLRANCLDGKALVAASQHGRESIVRLLLDYPRDAPRPDCRNCDALALCQHTAIRQLLQERLFAMLSPEEQERVMQVPVQ